MKRINFFISTILIVSMFSNVAIVLAQTKTTTDTSGSVSCAGLNNFIANTAKLGTIKNSAQTTILSGAQSQIANLSQMLASEITTQANSLIKEGVGALAGLIKKSPSSDTSTTPATTVSTASPPKNISDLKAPQSIDPNKQAQIPDPSLSGKQQRAAVANTNTEVPVVDKTSLSAINKATSAVNSGAAATTTAVTTADKTKQQQDCNDLFAYYANKGVLADVMKTTFNWINTGNAGTPFYVLDQSSYFKSIFQQTLDKTLNADTGNDYLGSQVNKLLIAQQTGKTPTYNSSQDPNATFTNDFSSGGWDSWINTSMGDNPISRYLSTVNQIGRDVSNKQQLAQQELLQGNGFLSDKVCTKSSGVKDSNGNDICDVYAVKTPGAIIAQEAQTLATTQIRQLELADKMNQTLAGAFDTFFNNLLNKGFNSILSNTGTTNSSIFNSTGGFGVNSVLDSNGNNTIVSSSDNSTSPLKDTYEYSLGQGQGVSIDTITDTVVLNQILKDQYALTNKLKDTLVISKKLLENTGKLDYFLPGPNTQSVQYVSDNLSNMSNILPQYTTQYTMSADDIRNYYQSIGNGSVVASAGDIFFDPTTYAQKKDWNIIFAIPVLGNEKVNIVSDNGASSRDSAIDQIETITPYLTYKLGDPVTNSYIKYDPWFTFSLFNVNEQTKSDTSSNGKGQNASIGSSVGSTAGAIVGSIFPGIGTFIGSAVGNFVGGIIGGLFGSNDEHSFYTRSPLDKDSISTAIGIWLDDYWARITNTYGTDNLIATYLGIDTTSTSSDIRGYVKDAQTETSNLLTYNQQVQSIQTKYDDNIDTINQNTTELADIYTKVEKIVTTARARHIAQMAAQGVTVNTQCLDTNYYIGDTPTIADSDIARKELDTDPDLSDLKKYQMKFYTNLCTINAPKSVSSMIGALLGGDINICTIPTIK